MAGPVSVRALADKTCPRCGKTSSADAAFCPNDGTPLGGAPPPPDVDPYIGTVLSGEFEIRSVAGVGAMGKVYRAHQRSIDRDVAVKILHRELSGNLPLVQRFHREAKIASKLQHPHVVDVHLAGQLPDGALYIVMEYLDGLSLAAALASAGGTFGLERAVSIALQISDAVGEGHARGIVHRDLKPENVMLVRRANTSDWVKVLDFGIAKLSIGDQSMETAAGLIFGTARYISPEGAQGATVGPPGDVYAIATILYQLLAGRTPFDAEQPVGLLIKHLHETPPALRSWPAAANVPAAIERVIMENLEKDPARRAPNARALGAALAAAAKQANVGVSDAAVGARLSLNAAKAGVLDPTLDDVPAPELAPELAKMSVRIAAAPPVPVVEPDPRSGAVEARAPVVAPDLDRPREGRRSPGVVVLAFLLGAVLAVLLTRELGRRQNAERDAHLARARKAATAGHYIEPAGESLRDLVEAAEKKWPDDPEVDRLEAEAANDLVTRAMAARSGGDVAMARDLAKAAVELDPSDRAAALLHDQYEDELRLTASGGGGGRSRVLVTVPTARAEPGSRVPLGATILVGGNPPKNPVSGARFTATGPSLPQAGSVLPLTTIGPGRFEASFAPPGAGSYHVVFEADADGIPFRAERTVDVAAK